MKEFFYNLFTQYFNTIFGKCFLLPPITFPKTLFIKTPLAGQWLCIAVGKEISDAENVLLEKICTALKGDLSSDILKMIIPSGEEISLSQAISKSIKLIISFGVPASQLGLWIDIPAQGYRWLNELMFINTLPLDELEKSATAKKQLWLAMQLFMETK